MSINQPKRVHEIRLMLDVRSFRATCSCGWQSVTRVRRDQAERDGADHVAKARGA
jgi:hypothetical protein